jgi:hypothetical protein
MVGNDSNSDFHLEVCLAIYPPQVQCYLIHFNFITHKLVLICRRESSVISVHKLYEATSIERSASFESGAKIICRTVYNIFLTSPLVGSTRWECLQTSKNERQ